VEHDALVWQVTAWREEGIEPHGIGIAARSNWMTKETAAASTVRRWPTVIQDKPGNRLLRNGRLFRGGRGPVLRLSRETQAWPWC
jgi:hypothetical protein